MAIRKYKHAIDKMSNILHLLYSSYAVATLVSGNNYYSYNGTDNNQDNPLWGSVGTLMRRLPNENNVVTYLDSSSVKYICTCILIYFSISLNHDVDVCTCVISEFTL